MKEKWKAVPGYEGLYEVSNLGRVRSVYRIVRACGTCHRRAFGRVLKPYNNKLNYQSVALSKDGKIKTYSVHRLVATMFIPNPNNLPIINHKDENPSNNRADNLEWCTQLYNVNYGNGKAKSDAKSNHNRKSVDKLDMDWNYICTYRSISDAARDVGVTKASISACLRGKGSNGRRITSSGGFRWRFSE